MIGGHGGNIYGLARQLGCQPQEICDMSANVNPLGPMPAMMAHLKSVLPVVTALPEVDAHEMVCTFARYYDVDPARVMAGNGTTQLIYLLPRALQSKKALVAGPTYADYEDACRMHQVNCRHLIGREADGFAPDMALLREKAGAVDLVFLCNPNNPTGTLTPRSDIETLCRARPDTVFVIDESYLPFAAHPARDSLIGTDLSNVVVLNSMSKAFRIPGLRIGFAVTSRPVMARLKPLAMPWTVNSLAQAAVQWLMTHPQAVNDFLAATRTLLASEKAGFTATLARQSAMHCFPSATSFVLMRLPDGLTSAAAWRHMAEQRILIRDCANFRGLSEAYIRVSLKGEAENQRAADLLVQLCRAQTGRKDIHGR